MRRALLPTVLSVIVLLAGGAWLLQGGAPRADARIRKLLAYTELALQRPAGALEVLKPLTSAPDPDAETLDLAARAHAQQGDLHKAESNLSKAATMQPANTEILNHLAAAKLKLGEFAEGQAALHHSLDRQPDQPAAAQALVQTALAAGDFDGARRAVELLRAATGDTEMVGVLDATVKTATLDLDGARMEFAAVLKRFPQSRAAMFGLLQAEGRLGDAKDAEGRLSAWMELHPADKEAFTLQIKTLTGAGDINGATAAAETVHAANPADVDITDSLAALYITAKSYDKALALLDHGGNASNPRLLAVKGQALVLAGRDEDARQAFAQAAEAAPAALAPRLGLLELALRRKDLSAARAIVQDALHAIPGNPRLQQALVGIDLKRGGLQAALQTAETLKQDPRNLPTALLLPASLYEANGDPARAADAYVAAYHASPSPEVALAAASALARIGHRPDGDMLATDWAGKDPKDPAVRQFLAADALQDGRWQDAGKWLDQILALQPDNAIALNNAAWVRLRVGDKAAARTDALRAYFLAPSPDTEDTLGWMLIQAGQGAQAEPLLHQAAAARPKSDILYHYAVALQAGGKPDDARAALIKALVDPMPFDGRADAAALLAKLQR